MEALQGLQIPPLKADKFIDKLIQQMRILPFKGLCVFFHIK
jgi:hypothetical protein